MTHMQLVSKQECGRCLIEAQTAQGTAFWRVASRRHDATFLVKLLELGRRERESERESACGKRLGKEHVRRLATYSAAIFPSDGVTWLGTCTMCGRTGRWRSGRSSLLVPEAMCTFQTRTACERDEGEMLFWMSELSRCDQLKPDQVYEVVYQGR